MIKRVRKGGVDMGAWNTSLYGNDTARDVKGDYVHKLRSGKSDQEAMEAMLVEYERTKDDEDEGPLFWLALADTQWEYGRLTEPVREKALQLLAQGVDQERWSEAGAEKLEAWNETCRALGEKLRSPQPPRKRIRPYKLYQCPWALGDVFAYRFSCVSSREKGFAGKYVVFRKVGEDTWWPGHRIPVVRLYRWIGENIPPLDQLAGYGLQEVGVYPTILLRYPDWAGEYSLGLITESAKDIPQENLTYLGNLPGEDLSLPPDELHTESYVDTTVGWDGSKYNRWFEEYVLKMYLLWLGK